MSKGKGTADFKRTLIGFFRTLVTTLEASELLYNETDLMDNIEVWISAMTSASNRPFRHTATVISLAELDGLCDAGRALIDSQAKSQRQIEGEAKSKKINKARIHDIQLEVEQASIKLKAVEDAAKNLFDGVFVHRYRDVDERVRVECVLHLSTWILKWPEYFFSGEYLRYVGWLLSDPSTPTRHEAIKQLHRLYKDQDRMTGLQAFTEKFKARMIEMATRDAEIGVRAATIELLDALRAGGILEPDDIDAVGRLIFDAEPRVRKAVVPFFVASVEDSFNDKKDDLGGETAIEEGLPAAWADEDATESPSLAWLELKALVELFESFEPDEIPANFAPDGGNWHEQLVASGSESHFSVAAQSLCSGMVTLKNWQLIAGYLLYDSSRFSEAIESEVEALFRQQCRLNEKEEAILLDLLHISVKMSITDIVHEGKTATAKKTKKQPQLILNKQEEAAQQLAILIPKLLTKYGSSPQAASAVLRLQRTLRLEVFQELRQDSTTFAALLENVAKQFNEHQTSDVLTEASNAFMHARQFPSLDEVTDEHLQSLWDETSYQLMAHCRGEELESRGAIDSPTLLDISNTVLRLVSLARKCDCISAFTTPKTYVSANSRRKTGSERPIKPISLLIAMVARGIPATGLDSEIEAMEDELVSNTTSALLCYFMWQAHRLRSTPGAEAGDLTDLATLYSELSVSLLAVVNSTRGADALRIQVTDDLLNLHSLYSIQPEKPDTAFSSFQDLISPISAPDAKTLLHLFTATESDFARKTKRKLDDPADDEEPEDPEDEDSESEDDVEDGAAESLVMRARKDSKARSALLAEHQLCTLTGRFVFAILAGAIEGEKDGEEQVVRKRLGRNKGRLGANFAQVFALLEEPGKVKMAQSARAKAKTRKAGKVGTVNDVGKGRAEGKKGRNLKSKETIDDEDEDEDEDDMIVIESGGLEEREALRRRGLLVEEDIAARDLPIDPVEEVEDGSVVGD